MSEADDRMLEYILGKAFEQTFTIRVMGKLVTIEASEGAEFKHWMMACEFLLHKTAQMSNAGYEKATELLCGGSTTYKDERIVRL